MDDNGDASQQQQQPPDLLPFPLARTWGAEAPPPCTHVLLAEFDIDRGWCVLYVCMCVGARMRTHGPTHAARSSIHFTHPKPPHSTMRHQHPSPVAGGQAAADALAETMLPEGAHARREDRWVAWMGGCI